MNALIGWVARHDREGRANLAAVVSIAATSAVALAPFFWVAR